MVHHPATIKGLHSKLDASRALSRGESMCGETVEGLPLKEKVDWFVNRVFGGNHRCRTIADCGNHYLVIPSNSQSFATFDGSTLTRIVMMSHRLCLRAEVECNGMHGLRLTLHSRPARESKNLWGRHPDVEEMVKDFPPLKIGK